MNIKDSGFNKLHLKVPESFSELGLVDSHKNSIKDKITDIASEN
jgi:hypothetical protein